MRFNDDGAALWSADETLNVADDNPFRHWVIDDLVPPEMAVRCSAAVPAADLTAWVRYWSDCESRKWAMNDLNVLGPAWRSLFGYLTTEVFLAKWSNLLDVPLSADPICWGGGLHLMFGGGRLAPHLDYSLHPNGLERRLNLILYLTGGAAHGGETVLCDPLGHALVVVEPRFNRALLWEAGDVAYHGVNRIDPESPPRLTAAVYYLAPPRPRCSRRRAVFLPTRE